MGEGISVFSKAVPTDPITTPTGAGAAYLRGAQEWFDKGYFFTHGPHGYGYHSDSLPWGESVDMDTYLGIEGHAR